MSLDAVLWILLVIMVLLLVLAGAAIVRKFRRG